MIGVRKVGVTAVSEGGFARDSDVEGMHLLQNYIRTMGVKDLDRAGDARPAFRPRRQSDGDAGAD